MICLQNLCIGIVVVGQLETDILQPGVVIFSSQHDSIIKMCWNIREGLGDVLPEDNVDINVKKSLSKMCAVATLLETTQIMH